jgi:hypothetical protein
MLCGPRVQKGWKERQRLRTGRRGVDQLFGACTQSTQLVGTHIPRRIKQRFPLDQPVGTIRAQRAHQPVGTPADSGRRVCVNNGYGIVIQFYFRPLDAVQEVGEAGIGGGRDADRSQHIAFDDVSFAFGQRFRIAVEKRA